MEKITCKACQAVVDEKLEFCSSCGEWLGLKIEDLEDTTTPNDSRFQKRTRVPQIRCNNCGNNNLPSIKNCKECGLLLVRPLSNYGATELPTRKEVPGIRAVFFLALIIPLIAGASYFYNTRLAEEVIEEIEIVEQTTSTITTTTLQSRLKVQTPISCGASSKLEANNPNDFWCENLYDNSLSSWQDNGLRCEDAWLEFKFEKDIFIEFIVIVNVEKSSSFKRNYKIRDLIITTKNEDQQIQIELENRNSDQWLDINATTDYLRIDVLSAYPGEEFNGKEPFKECAVQEVRFFGKDTG